MTYIQTISVDQASGVLKNLYAELMGKRGKLAAVHEAQSLNSDVLRQHMALYMATMFGQSPLSRAEREMIAVVVSAANQCGYCTEHHAQALNHYWKNQERIAELKSGRFAVHLNAREYALCIFAQVLTQNAAAISDNEHMIPLRESGLNDREILDAVGIISYFNYVNRIVLGLGVHLEGDGGGGFKY